MSEENLNETSGGHARFYFRRVLGVCGWVLLPIALGGVVVWGGWTDHQSCSQWYNIRIPDWKNISECVWPFILHEFLGLAAIAFGVFMAWRILFHPEDEKILFHPEEEK